jgi:ribosomal protein S18 acetylase RimI-like enzyme
MSSINSIPYRIAVTLCLALGLSAGAQAATLLRLARATHTPLGYTLTLLRGDSPAARLYSIVVARMARDSGVGKCLLADAEAQARQRGAQSLRLEVRADNHAAIALYRAVGYQPFGCRRAYYEDGMDALRLSRRL